MELGDDCVVGISRTLTDGEAAAIGGRGCDVRLSGHTSVCHGGLAVYLDVHRSATAAVGDSRGQNGRTDKSTVNRNRRARTYLRQTDRPTTVQASTGNDLPSVNPLYLANMATTLYRRRPSVKRSLIHDLLFLPISTTESAVGKRLITHCCVSRLACSRLSGHIEPHSPRLQA